jgi:hypothetical protein
MKDEGRLVISAVLAATLVVLILQVLAARDEAPEKVLQSSLMPNAHVLCVDDDPMSPRG